MLIDRHEWLLDGPSPKVRLVRGGLLTVVFGAFALLTLHPLWGSEGWPGNHEYQNFVVRLQVYVEHLALGDPFPIWSSTDTQGLGSPQPLYYHKLFYLVAASLSGLLAGHVKAALILSLLVFLTAGAFGVRALMLELDGSPLAAAGAGLALISANYTVTNWLVRGALAELSAAMLVPWALLYFQRSVRTSRVPWGLGLSLGLLFLAHSVICYYLCLLFAVATLVLGISGQVPWRRVAVGPVLATAGLAVALTAPYVAVMTALAGQFDMGRIVPPAYHPTSRFHPLAEYLFDRTWHWGERWDRYTVQLDVPLTAAIVAALAALVLVRRTPAGRGPTGGGNRLAPMLPLALVAVLCVVLQTRLSAPFYDMFPGAKYLQFPWRLLGVITPIAIVSALWLPERVFAPRLARAAVVGCVAAMVLSSGVWAPIRYPRLEGFGQVPATVDFSAYGEYLPRAMRSVAPPAWRILADADGAGCRIERLDGTPREVLTARYRARCSGAAAVPLPLVGTTLHRITVSSTAGPTRASACTAAEAYPGLCTVLLQAGESLVTVEMPRFGLFLPVAWGPSRR